jgi:hypothetical protein
VVEATELNPQCRSTGVGPNDEQGCIGESVALSCGNDSPTQKGEAYTYDDYIKELSSLPDIDWDQ